MHQAARSQARTGLTAETDDNCQDQGGHTGLKESQPTHGAIRIVEEKNDHDIQDGDGAARNQRYLRDEEIDGDGRADDLLPC